MAANTLDDIIPKVLARGLILLRKRLIMPTLVNSDFALEAATFGKTIDVPIPADRGAAGDVTPSNTPPTPTARTPDTTPIVLDKWKHADFFLTDKDKGEINARRDFIPPAMEEAVDSIAQAVNADLFATYKGVYGFVGTPGTTPFGSGVTVQSAIDLRKVLHTQKAPRNQRRLVLDYTAEAAALALPEFADVDRSGDDMTKREGEIGRKYGFDIFSDDDVPYHTKGTGTGYQVNDGSGLAVGVKTIPVDTGSGTILEGDIITFAGHTQTYAVTSALSGGSFSIYPGLVSAVANDEAVTVKGSHRVNLAFQRGAIAFANRPLANDPENEGLGSRILSMQDPQTGLTMRLEVSRQYKQTVWDFDILYGCKLVRPELAARLAG